MGKWEGRRMGKWVCGWMGDGWLDDKGWMGGWVDG